MKTSERMLEAVEEIWQEYYDHPFVLGIMNGDLDHEKFRYYIIQDYLYLEDYAKTFAVGIAKASCPESAKLFAGYINLLVGNEMDTHRGYLGAFGITTEELRNTPVSLMNLSYTSYMLRVAYEEGELEILTAILACALSYEAIAREIVRRRPQAVEDPFYGEWIKEYISDSYAEENRVLLEVFDDLAEYVTEERLQHMISIFRICSWYEKAFWDMAWNMGEASHN